MGSNIFVWARVLDTRKPHKGAIPDWPCAARRTSLPTLVIPTLCMKSGEKAMKLVPPFVENS